MGRRRWLYRLTSRMQLFCTSILSQPVWVSAATGYLFADCLGNIVLWFLLPRLLLDGGGQKRREFRKIIFTTRRAKDHQFGTPFPWVRAGPADENDYGRANTVSFYLERGGRNNKTNIGWISHDFWESRERTECSQGVQR